MTHRLILMKIIPVVFSVAISWIPSAQAEENCNTALSRLAKTAAESAVKENKETACSGFKLKDSPIPIAIDKTKVLELVDFKLCEDGAVVKAHIKVNIECATSDNAMIKASQSDTLSAQASANLDSCTVSDSQIQASSDLTKVGLNLLDANQKFKEAAEREIRKFCQKAN